MVASRRTAKDIMTSPVFTVRSANPLGKVVDVICRHRVGGVPVVKGKGRLVGLISERDIINAMYSGTRPDSKISASQRADGSLRDISLLTAKDIMVTDVITASPDTEFLRLASIMSLEKVRRIPIVEGEILVGIVSHGDVSRAIFGTTDPSAVCPAILSDDDLPS